jgi:catechol 2,3-dioxygenase-like lactoylglutathione lyase family enzyme
MAVTSPRAQQIAPMPAFVGSVHEGIPVHDAEVALKFYTEVLGLKVLPRPSVLGPGYWLGDENDTVQFHIIQSDKDVKPGPDAAISPTGRHTAWVVRSLEPFRERLRQLGVEFKELPPGSIVPSAQLFIKDPDGHTWEFQEVMS